MLEENPFLILERQLNRIETLLTEKKPTIVEESTARSIDFIPISEICGKEKYMSKPTFYSHVKKGTINLYKLGSKSFVKWSEFSKSFNKLEL